MSHDREVFTCPVCNLQNWDSNGQCRCGCEPKDLNTVQQVGGDHYKAKNNYQHWDWCIDISLGYLEAAATKYITRWKGKNGVQDVMKGISYLEKAKEAYLQHKYHNRSTLIGKDVELSRTAGSNTSDFIAFNNLSDKEGEFMWRVAAWQYSADLLAAIKIAKEILKQATEHQALQAGATPSKLPTMALNARATVSSGGARGVAAQPPKHSASTEGQEHPFGYDEWYEGDI